jgi:hypothetical protein
MGKAFSGVTTTESGKKRRAFAINNKNLIIRYRKSLEYLSLKYFPHISPWPQLSLFFLRVKKILSLVTIHFCMCYVIYCYNSVTFLYF